MTRQQYSKKTFAQSCTRTNHDPDFAGLEAEDGGIPIKLINTPVQWLDACVASLHQLVHDVVTVLLLVNEHQTTATFVVHTCIYVGDET